MKTTRMMRFLLIVLSLAMALSLFACAEEPTVEDTTAAATDAPTEETSKDTTAESAEATTAETTVSTEETTVETEDTGIETTTGDTEDTTDTSDTEAPVTSDTEDTDTSDTETTDTTETEPTTPACEHANKTSVEAKAATCTEDGNDAYSSCPDCGKYFDAEGEEIAAIPTIAAAHAYAPVAKKDATCTEDGYEAYKTCENCDGMWNADGEEIEAIVAIPAAHTIKAVDAKEANCKKGGNEAYTTCEVCNAIWAADGTELEAIPETPINADNHVAKEDVPAMLPTTSEEGNDAYSKCRGCGKFWNADGEEIAESDIVTYPVIVPATDKYFGVEILSTMAIGGTQGSKFNAPEISADRSYVRFSRAGESDDGNVNFMASNTEVTGKYFIIKYRTDHMASGEIWANTTEDGHSVGKANTYASFVSDGEWHIAVYDLSASISNYVKPNDEGQYIIQWARIDLLNGKASEGYFDVAYIAFCDDLTEVASITQEGDEALCPHFAAETPTYANEGDKHSTDCVICGVKIYGNHYAANGTSWNTEAKVYTGACVCGTAVTSEMIYITTPANTDAAVASSGNFIKITQEDGFVRYTPTKSVTDPYFYIYRNGTAVTGQYMVIKYRLVNNNTSISLSAPFASSAASGKTGAAGSGGDSSNKLVSEKLIADGEWHYFMVSPQEANTTFVANADGTYSWAYLRVRFNTFAAYDDSCYIDIAEVAFADNIYAAETYIGKYETELPFFVGNLDKGNCSLDGANTVTDSVRGTREPIALDLAEKTLTTPTSLALGGWLCTPGGVDCYKIRVTKVNGEAVAEPTLVDFHGGDNRSDIYTAAGKSYGYSDACATGAGFKATVDLTAYAGQTVDFEIVGITNYGVEVVFVTVANVTVPSLENVPNFVIDAGKLAGLTEHKGLTYALSDDGEYVTYTHKEGAEWDDCYAYAIFPPANINVPGTTTGEYVLIKYKTTSTLAWGMFIGANNGSTQAAGGKDSFSVGMRSGETGVVINDGEWQYLIIDTSTFLKDWGGVLPEDGTEDVYSIDYLRIDYFNAATDGGETVDVAYIAISDSVDKLVEYAGMTSYIYADSYSGGLQGTVVTVGE